MESAQSAKLHLHLLARTISGVGPDSATKTKPWRCTETYLGANSANKGHAPGVLQPAKRDHRFL